jgi:glycosyltransferase involved in cell wall biosynthesis
VNTLITFAAGFNIGVTAGVETTVCNPGWITKINQMDLVIVPSEFVKNTFLNTGKVKTLIHVIPESFPDCFLEEQPKITTLGEKLDGLKTNFNFLVVGMLTGNNPENDRKNIQYMMKWFSEAFRGVSEDVGLVIKTSAARQTHLDRTMVQNVLHKTLIENKLVDPSFVCPKFYLLHGDMTDEEMKILYSHKKIKALLNCSKGEGFGLPVLEAACLGLPVIATNWSGYLDFLNKGKFIKLDYKLQDLHQSRLDGQIFVQGAKWAQPVEEDVKTKLVKFYNKPEIPQQWATELKKTIQTDYSFESIKRNYDEILLPVILA